MDCYKSTSINPVRSLDVRQCKAERRQTLSVMRFLKCSTMLAGLCGIPGAAVAQNANWLANPPTTQFTSGANWSTNSVPTGTAFLGQTTKPAIDLSASLTIGGITQQATATSGYTLNIANNTTLTLTGTGLTNNSALPMTVNGLGGGTNINLQNSASLGNATVSLNGNLSLVGTSSAGSGQVDVFGVTTFAGSSSAGSSTFRQRANTISFSGTSTLGQAALELSNGTQATFSANSSAGTGSLAILDGTTATFDTNSTLGAASVQSLSLLNFSGASSAGSGTIVQGLGPNAGLTTFSGTSRAGTATISAINGGRVSFTQASSGDQARVNSGAGSFVDFSGLTTGGTTVGSIEGAGSFSLGGKQLTTGGNNLSTAVSGAITGVGGSLVKTGTGTLILTGTNSYSGGTIVADGTLQGTTTGLQGNILNASSVVFDQTTIGTYASVMSGSGSLTKQNTGTVILTGANTYRGGTTVSGGALQGNTTSLQGNIVNNALVVFDQTGTGTYAGVMSGTGAMDKQNTGTVILTGMNTYTGRTTIGNGVLQLGNATTAGALSGDVRNQTTFNIVNADLSRLTSIVDFGGSTHFFNNSSAASVAIASTGGGNPTFHDNSTAGNATFDIDYQSNVTFTGNSRLGTAFIGSTGGVNFLGSSSADHGTIEIDGSKTDSPPFPAHVGQLSFSNTSTAGNAALFAINAGFIQFFDSSTGGNARIAVDSVSAMSIRDLSTNGMTAGSIEGAGLFILGSKQLTTGTNNLSTEVSGTITGLGGSLIKVGTGTLNLTGVNDYTGPTFVRAGKLAVNGSITSATTVEPAGTLSGTGTIFGNVVTQGTIAPGNSIGTLNVVGAYSQVPGSIYQLEINPAGQSDRIAVTGAASIQGGDVSVIRQAGTYNLKTVYTIVTTTAGVTGTYSGVALAAPSAFLHPSLSYDAKNVYLTLLTDFTAPPMSTNQSAVGAALNVALAETAPKTDLATVFDGLLGLTGAEAPRALSLLAGEQYSAFANAIIYADRLFQNEVGRQMFLSRSGGDAGRASRLALAEACGATCDEQVIKPFSVWGSPYGSLGTVQGDYSAHTLNYTIGGFAVGLDYRLDPRFAFGVAAGYTNTVFSLNDLGANTGYENAVKAAVYATFKEGGFYVDALGGLGHHDEALSRMIAFSGFGPRTAHGQTTALSYFGRVEAGYRFGLYEPAALAVTPFAQFDALGIDQAGFTEWGAGSINLNVAQQTTTSLRSLLGAELSGAMDVGFKAKLETQLRLGWAHEYASASRPVTASFTGAPLANFTVLGAEAARNSLIIGLGVQAPIAEATRVYLRYDGEISDRNSGHALTAGLRMSF